jgi:hypothetical protein
MNADHIWNLLLPQGMFDPNGPVLNGLISAIGDQMDTQENNVSTLVLNMAPQTADLDGIVVWEQILKLPNDNKLSLQQRQLRASAVAFRMGGALTQSKFNDLLNAFDPARNVVVTTNPSTYQVWGTFGVHDIDDIIPIILAATNVLPAHLQFIPILTLGIPQTSSASSSQSILVDRSVYFSNGGDLKTGEVLDGTWNVDDGLLLNGVWTQGPSIVSSQTITMTAFPQITETISNSITISTAANPNIATSSTEQITVGRVAVMDNTNVLESTWALDGSRTLAGGEMRCSVKINGVAA